MAVDGIKRVSLNSKKQFERIMGPVTERAVYVLLSQGAAIADTMTPIETSNLINSRYEPQISQGNGVTRGSVGYTAAYAPYVHDAPGTLKGLPRSMFGGGTGNFWDPNAEPQFLEKGMEEVRKDGRAILEKIYRV